MPGLGCLACLSKYVQRAGGGRQLPTFANCLLLQPRQGLCVGWGLLQSKAAAQVYSSQGILGVGVGGLKHSSGLQSQSPWGEHSGF